MYHMPLRSGTMMAGNLNSKKDEHIYFLIFTKHFSRLCRSLEECITISVNGTLLYRPYQPMV